MVTTVDKPKSQADMVKEALETIPETLVPVIVRSGVVLDCEKRKSQKGGENIFCTIGGTGVSLPVDIKDEDIPNYQQGSIMFVAGYLKETWKGTTLVPTYKQSLV
ncbi:MAG: hypothetical protein AAGB26_03690 [Planctomycetota bacterium]